MSRLSKFLKSNQENLNIADNVATIICAIFTIIFGILTFSLTIKYGENKEQINLLTKLYLDNHQPYFELVITSITPNKDGTQTVDFSFENNGGALVELDIKKKNHGSLDFSENLKRNMSRNCKIPLSLPVEKHRNISGNYLIHYKDIFEREYEQELTIFQDNELFDVNSSTPVLIKDISISDFEKIFSK